MELLMIIIIIMTSMLRRQLLPLLLIVTLLMLLLLLLLLPLPLQLPVTICLFIVCPSTSKITSIRQRTQVVGVGVGAILPTNPWRRRRLT
jgi:hypothetical protein